MDVLDTIRRPSARGRVGLATDVVSGTKFRIESQLVSVAYVSY